MNKQLDSKQIENKPELYTVLPVGFSNLVSPVPCQFAYVFVPIVQNILMYLL